MQDWVKIAVLVLKISIPIQVFALGLSSTWYDATFLFRQPRLLVNSILARNIAVPIIALALIGIFSLDPAVEIALCVLAVTPVPPVVPRGLIKAGESTEYILGLLVSQAALAIVVVPLTVRIMDWILGVQARFSPAQVAALVLQTILVPLAAAMVIARLYPAIKSLAPHLLTIGTVLLIAGSVPLLFLTWNAITAITGNGTLVAITIFAVAAMAVGHVLGGPSPGNRTVLAEATSSRHPGMAIAIAASNFREQAPLVAGAIVIYLIIRMILSIPYMRRRPSSPDLTTTHSYRRA